MIRAIHWTVVMKNTTTPNAATTYGSQGSGHHRFIRPLRPIHEDMTTTKMANENPPGFVVQERHQCPRANHDQLVVIPHEGHGIPHMVMAPHAGKPSFR